MKIIEPEFHVYEDLSDPDVADAMLRKIEVIGRTCYKSEDKICEGSASRFVRRLVESQHEAMLEHVSITVLFTVDRGISHELVRHRIASFAQSSTRYCVAGDTVIRGMGQKSWTVKQLYEWLNDPQKKGRVKLINARSVDEHTNKIVKNKIVDIVYVGNKKTYELKTESGRTIICTGDHELYTPIGYVQLSDLNVGDTVYANGIELLENEDWLRNYYLKENHTRSETAKEIGCCESLVYRSLKKFGIVKPLSDRPNRHPGHGVTGMFSAESIRRLSESKQGDKNPQYIKDRRKIKKSGAYAEAHRKYDGLNNVCEYCRSNNNVEIHHIDKNPRNNNKENIRFLCNICHNAVHEIGKIAVFPDKVVSITEVGIKDVYDVQMQAPYHNFVANGIVAHNCNYSHDKFGNEIIVIHPFFLKVGSPEWMAWYDSCQKAEQAYMEMLKHDCTPQEARTVLPNSLKTDIWVTCNLREWRTIMKLRAAGVTGKPHPQMTQVTVPLLKHFRKYLPEVFDDIEVPDNA